ncbi:pilus assembly protein PilP [Vibrio sp. HN007]|uniref:pilus assembly protein PilP n=1 Tax=Vibrio iocasae TaxID=3098914 RepID=UPI0035D4121B
MNRIRKLDLHDIPNWPRGFQITLLVTLSVFLQGAAFRFVVQPKQHWIDEQKSMEITLQNSIAIHANNTAQLKGKESELRQQVKVMKGILNSTVRENTETDVLTDINTFVSETDLILLHSAKGNVIEGEDYSRHQLEVEVTGSFHDVRAFLKFISMLDVMAIVEKMKLSRSGPDSSAILGQLSIVIFHPTNKWIEHIKNRLPDFDIKIESFSGGIEERREIYVEPTYTDPFHPPLAKSYLKDSHHLCLDAPKAVQLNYYKLSELSLKGTLTSTFSKKALIQLPEGKIVAVREGDWLGYEGWIISRINESELLMQRQSQKEEGCFLQEVSWSRGVFLNE